MLGGAAPAVGTAGPPTGAHTIVTAETILFSNTMVPATAVILDMVRHPAVAFPMDGAIPTEREVQVQCSNQDLLHPQQVIRGGGVGEIHPQQVTRQVGELITIKRPFRDI